MNIDGLPSQLAEARDRTKQRIERGEKGNALLLNGAGDPHTSTDSTISASLEAPPCLADLLDESAHLILRYVRLPVPWLAVLVACWIALTYSYGNFRYCGYLALR